MLYVKKQTINKTVWFRMHVMPKVAVKGSRMSVILF